MRKISLWGAVFSALLYLSPVSATYYYATSATAARSACTSSVTASNSYYCYGSLMSPQSGGGQTNIVWYALRNPTGTNIDVIYFGYIGIKPTSFICPSDTMWNYTNGNCTGTISSTEQNFCPAAEPSFTYIAGKGCQNDFDLDGILTYLDNCPEIANPDQSDSDGDGVGDVCDTCSPGQYQHNVTASGDYIKSATLPASICNTNKCNLNLVYSGCDTNAGTCTISYNSNGAICATVNMPNLLDYISSAPSGGYWYDHNRDFNAVSNMISGVSNYITSPDGCFQMMGCNATDEAQAYLSIYSWSFPRTCQNPSPSGSLSTAQLDEYINNSVNAEIHAGPVAVSGDISYYRAYGNYEVKNVISNFGLDSNESVYTIYAYQNQVEKRQYSGYPPDGSPGGQSVWSSQPRLKIQIRGCGYTGTSGGGSGGGTSSAALEEMASHFNEDRGDKSPEIDSFSTEMFSKYDSLIDVLNGDYVPTSSDELYNLAPNLDNIQCAENSMHQIDCTDIGHNSIAPGFFNQLTSVFNNQNSCPTLTVNIHGFVRDALLEFCNKWDQYGRPVFSFVFYYWTLIGVAGMWLNSGSSR